MPGPGQRCTPTSKRGVAQSLSFPGCPRVLSPRGAVFLRRVSLQSLSLGSPSCHHQLNTGTPLFISAVSAWIPPFPPFWLCGLPSIRPPTPCDWFSCVVVGLIGCPSTTSVWDWPSRPADLGCPLLVLGHAAPTSCQSRLPWGCLPAASSVSARNILLWFTLA